MHRLRTVRHAAGADVTAVDGDGQSALTHAAIGGRHDVMLRLLQADRADLSVADTAHGRHGHRLSASQIECCCPLSNFAAEELILRPLHLASLLRMGINHAVHYVSRSVAVAIWADACRLQSVSSAQDVPALGLPPRALGHGQPPAARDHGARLYVLISLEACRLTVGQMSGG